MILSHDKKKPRIDSDSYVAPTAVVCRNVRVDSGSRIMFGAGVIAEGKLLQAARTASLWRTQSSGVLRNMS